jgi:hypothetical protein
MPRRQNRVSIVIDFLSLVAAGVRRGMQGSRLAGDTNEVVTGTANMTGAYGSGPFPLDRHRPIKGVTWGMDGCRRCRLIAIGCAVVPIRRRRRNHPDELGRPFNSISGRAILLSHARCEAPRR